MKVDNKAIHIPQMRGKFQSYHLNVMCNVVKSIVNHPIHLLEIGAFSGESTQIFSYYFESVHSVDCWEMCNSVNDELGSEIDMALVRQAYQNRVKNLNNVTYNQMTSNEFFNQEILRKHFNMVYIDGEHTKDALTSDIENCLEKLKDDVIISGHDYADGWKEVKDVVRHYFDDKPLMVFQDGSWLVMPEKYL